MDAYVWLTLSGQSVAGCVSSGPLWDIATRVAASPLLSRFDTSNAILYLVSDDGRHVTGTTHLADAGDQL